MLLKLSMIYRSGTSWAREIIFGLWEKISNLSRKTAKSWGGESHSQENVSWALSKEGLDSKGVEIMAFCTVASKIGPRTLTRAFRCSHEADNTNKTIPTKLLKSLSIIQRANSWVWQGSCLPQKMIKRDKCKEKWLLVQIISPLKKQRSSASINLFLTSLPKLFPLCFPLR